MKIKVFFLVFLFACIFITGCGKKIKNSRAEFQQITSNVKLELDEANIESFQMYLPLGFMEYIPDSRKYKKDTIKSPSGKEYKVICPYSKCHYEKNNLELFAEEIDKTIQNSSKNHHSNENSVDKTSKIFINKDKASLIYVIQMPLIKESKVNFVFDKIIDYMFKSIKNAMKKNYSTMQEYDFSSSFADIDFLYYCDKKDKDSSNYFNLASVRTSTGSALLFSFQFDKDEKNDVIASLLSIKPNTTSNK